MHMSEAFPFVYTNLSLALEDLGFRCRDAWVVEMLVAELKAWERAEVELERTAPSVPAMLFKGDGSVEVVAPSYRERFPHTCTLAETLLGKYRDEPGDPRFLA